MIKSNRTLIGTAAAAKILGCSQPRVRQMVSSGKVWSESVGNLLLLDENEIKKLASEMKRQRAEGSVCGPKPGGFRSDSSYQKKNR